MALKKTNFLEESSCGANGKGELRNKLRKIRLFLSFLILKSKPHPQTDLKPDQLYLDVQMHE